MKTIDESTLGKGELGIAAQIEILRSKVPFDAFDAVVAAMMRQRAHLDRL